MPQVREAEIHNDYWGSDHCPVSLTLDTDGIDLEEFREFMALNQTAEKAIINPEECSQNSQKSQDG